jgi:hypothetical protein
MSETESPLFRFPMRLYLQFGASFVTTLIPGNNKTM